MKKHISIFLASLIVLSLVLISCGGGSATTNNHPQTATAAPPATAANPSTTGAPTVSSAAAGQPVRGGALTIIDNLFPDNLGYTREIPATGEFDCIYAETLAEPTDDYGTLIPLLATSWEEDTAAKTFTVHLREGVKFHDGTGFDAEAAKWNYQERTAGFQFGLGKMLKAIDVLDKYTLRFTLNDYPYNTATSILEDVTFYSPTAIKTNGRDWAISHETGTGPFTVVDFQPGVSFTAVRFDDYWQKDKGYPYLDKIIEKRIGDPLVQQALMEAKQADIWEAPNDPTPFIDMEKKGFKVRYTGKPAGNLAWFLRPEVKPDSIFNNIKVREALACAMDTEALAQAIGKGIYKPLNQLAYEGINGYNPDFKNYNYNLERAKQLLKEAGYPSGFHTKLTYESTMTDEANAVAALLKKANIDVELQGEMVGAWIQDAIQGWNGLMLFWADVDKTVDFIGSFNNWLGPNRSAPFQIRDWSPHVLELLNQGMHTYDPGARKDIAKQLNTEASVQLNQIPLYARPIACCYQPWVHCTMPNEGGYPWRHIYKVWMDPH
jgi:peptide/nickel transport system substrate-binding protein